VRTTARTPALLTFSKCIEQLKVDCVHLSATDRKAGYGVDDLKLDKISHAGPARQ
jgi:hypothetical protein